MNNVDSRCDLLIRKELFQQFVISHLSFFLLRFCCYIFDIIHDSKCNYHQMTSTGEKRYNRDNLGCYSSLNFIFLLKFTCVIL